MNITLYTIIMALATGISTFLSTFFLIRFAKKYHIYDYPGRRKIQTKPIPTMGGIAIFLNFWFFYFYSFRSFDQARIAIFIASAIILLTGIIDDRYDLSPLKKSIGIILASLVAFYGGNVRISTMTLPFVGYISLGFFSLLITVLWLFLITNAVNLMDGLDGLASGISMIALMTMGTIGYIFSSDGSVLALAGIILLWSAIAGFFPHNFFPAKIYLGDTGALFIGFMIAVFSLNNLKNATFFTMIIPFAVLGVPISDSVAAIFRRLMRKEPISRADKAHLHHRLLRLGFSHKQAVLLIFGLCLIFSLTALIFPISPIIGGILLVVGLICGGVLYWLSIRERKEK
ncbi:glycosyltransferase family 4 protein [Granulicatella seriolae]|uniref:Undecaprenyl/decaprenyl-phosphate alpha-N-acetylglucosaminyl 1-phosphate transferase n=1 Tax=Granulicatella seriolae TaxID=2967226 RepID=A0ABT1WPR4_9LACT|nr:MraY family glycosyltransferase [Granulicatella seriolae]